MRIFKYIGLLLFCLGSTNCGKNVTMKNNLGIENYFIGGVIVTAKTKYFIDYYYVKDSDKLLNDSTFRQKLLQFSFCKFRCDSTLNWIKITSKYFMNIHECEFEYEKDKGIVAELTFILEDGMKVPYFATINNRSCMGSLSRANLELLNSTNCDK